MSYQLIHHGAALGVTGSCHELRWGSDGFLVDCGLFQGESGARGIDFPIGNVRALLVTHAHIDHIGRIPALLDQGFRGPIFSSPATAELLPLMLEDGLRLQRVSGGQRQRIMTRIQQQLRPQPYGRWFRLPCSSAGVAGDSCLYARLQPAGHILGSAYIEFKLPDGQRLVFSGDLGSRLGALLPHPQPPERADLLVLESTYGQSHHDSGSERSRRLREIVERSLQDGGAILIPAFSIGRTQELLFDLEQIISEQVSRQDLIWQELPIVIDSPLAAQVTRSYRRYQSLWSQEAQSRVLAGRHPLNFQQCVTVSEHSDHLALVQRLASSGEPAVIVAASGMCQGGRILDYLQALLPDPRTDVLLAGFQAQGTAGRRLQTGAKQLVLESREVLVRAQIHSLSGYSAHADQQDLLAFVGAMPQPPQAIRLVHGEPQAQQALALSLRHHYPQICVEQAAVLSGCAFEAAASTLL
jgi:metallo-beta-lactamase family protein